MSRVFIDRFDQHTLRARVVEALDWVGIGKIVAPGARVFLKPNLTWKRPTRGVTVTPPFIRAVDRGAASITRAITIGESEGTVLFSGRRRLREPWVV